MHRCLSKRMTGRSNLLEISVRFSFALIKAFMTLEWVMKQDWDGKSETSRRVPPVRMCIASPLSKS
jgi:hypothetical protein